MDWVDLLSVGQASGPMELAVVYAVSAGAAVYLVRTIYRIFRPAHAGGRRKPAGCQNCNKCG